MARATTNHRPDDQLNLYAAESGLLDILMAHRPKKTLRDDSQGSVSFIAIDEVGRGCLAGPVVVCATEWQSLKLTIPPERWMSALKDSKKLSQQKREQLFTALLEHLGSAWLCDELTVSPDHKEAMHSRTHEKHLRMPDRIHKFSHAEVRDIACGRPRFSKGGYFSMVRAAIGSATAQEIDAHGLSEALNLAALRALHKLGSRTNPELLFFDGNRPLKLDSTWSRIAQCLVTQGDDCLKTISASSVLAKVVRDRWMDQYSASFPNFGFSENRGYGTLSHRNHLEKHGPTQLHRLSFLKNICPAQLP